MDKQIITFTANGQTLTRTSGECRYSSNKVSYIEANFELGENWSGFDSVRAVWFTDRISGVSTVLDTEGNCVVPSEVLKRKDTVYVNLVGSIVSDDILTDRLTTYPVVALFVDANSRVNGNSTQPLTPSEYEQFVASVKADADRAETAKEDARGYAEDAEASAQNALTSEANAHTSEVNAKASEDNAKISEDNASASADEAEEWADKAEQSAGQSGYMFFYIDDDGYIVYERTANVDVDFIIDEDGYICVEAAA